MTQKIEFSKGKSLVNSIRNLFYALVLTGMFSCSNEIEIFSDYKENAAVYGLLDLQSPVQYVRVGKTFLNPNASAKDIAQMPDSLFFDENVEVKLIEEQSSVEIILNRVDSIPKDTGFFQNTDNILYATDVPLKPNSSYRLYVQNKQTGYTATGRTTVVGNPQILFPVSFGNRFFNTHPDLTIQLRFNTGMNAKSQDAYFEFWVEEFPESDTNQIEVKKITWRFASNVVNEITTPRSQLAITPGEGFYDFFLASYERGVLRTDTSYRRRIKRMDMVVYSASLDLYEYVLASTPSIGIVQKQTDFNNIENGVGLFTSRNVTRISNLVISDQTIAAFNDPKFPKFHPIRMVR